MLVVLVAEQAAQAAGSSGGGLMAAFKERPTFLVANLVVSAVVIAMVIERIAFQLSKYSVNSKEFFAQIKKLVTAGNIDRAIKLCDAGDYPTLQLVKAGLTHANKGPDEIDAAMSEKMGELRPAVEKRVGSLWSLANIATLIGLIGTVTGLITTFNAVSDPRTLGRSAPGAAVARYLRGHVQHGDRSRHRRDLHDRAPLPAPAREEHPARPGLDAGARVQPPHDPDAPRQLLGGRARSTRCARYRRSSAPRSGAGFAGCRRRRELAPDEEGGELNIVPFLDIITNVLMFVLATISVTFTTLIDTQPPRGGRQLAARPTKPTLSLNIVIIDKGFIVSAFGQRIGEGCQGAGSGVTVGMKTTDGKTDYDYTALNACAKRLKNQVPEAADETAATITANSNVPYQVIVSTCDAIRKARRRARRSSPTSPSECPSKP